MSDSLIKRALLVMALVAVVRFVVTLGYEWQVFSDAEQVATVRTARHLQQLVHRDMQAVNELLAGQALLLQETKSHKRGDSELAELVARLPAASTLVRSLSVLDHDGAVLASSVPRHVGLVLELGRLVPKGAESGQQAGIGGLVAGRDVDALARPEQDTHSGGPTFVPMLRNVSLSNGLKLRLLAAVDMAHYDTSLVRSLPEPWLDAAVLNMRGQVLAATPGLEVQVGKAVPAHPFLRDYLPNRERGDYVGDGLRGHRVTTAMHAVPGFPLLVVVESDGQAAWASQLRPRLLLHGLGFIASAVTLLGLYVLVNWQLRKRAALVREVERSERERRASDELLAVTLQNVRELVIRTDADGRLTYVNLQWETVTGFPSDMVAGRFIRDLVQPEDRIRVEALFAPGSGARDSVLVRLQGRDEILRLDMSVASIAGHGEGHLGYVVIAIDVTQRQQVRDRLQDRLDSALRLLDMSPTAMFAKNVDGVYTDANRAFLHLMDLPAQHVLGQTAARLFPDNAMRHQTADSHVLRTGESVTYESQTDGPLGMRHLRLTKSRLCNGNGEPAGVVGSIVDVTLYRQAEMALREARNASIRSAQKRLNFERSFLSMAAHELRTPLTSLRLQTELVVGMSSVADRRAYGQELTASVDRIGHVLEQVMVLTRVDSMRENRLERHPVDLQTLFLKVMAELQEEAAQRRLQLRSRLHGRQVQGSELGIYTLMRNLLHNAILYSPLGGKISIAADQGDDAVTLKVDDSGPGIPPELRERAFERFNRLGQQTVKGSGLGLSIVKTIADLHGATVSLEQSTLGGLRVVVSFSLTPAMPPAFQDSMVLDGAVEQR